MPVLAAVLYRLVPVPMFEATLQVMTAWNQLPTIPTAR